MGKFHAKMLLFVPPIDVRRSQFAFERTGMLNQFIDQSARFRSSDGITHI